jgi:hypothetical protein
LIGALGDAIRWLVDSVSTWVNYTWSVKVEDVLGSLEARRRSLLNRFVLRPLRLIRAYISNGLRKQFSQRLIAHGVPAQAIEEAVAEMRAER